MCVLGAFGLVKVGWLRSEPNVKYAIKSMKKHEIIQSKHVDHIENEKNILNKMDHPFGVSSHDESEIPTLISPFTPLICSVRLVLNSYATMAFSKMIVTFILLRSS